MDARLHAQMLRSAALVFALLAVAGCDRLGAASSTEFEVRMANQRIRSDDGAFTARVKAALDADPDVARLDIKLKSRNGVVFLSGQAGSTEQAAHVVAVARGVEGTNAVMSAITIVPGRLVAKAD